MSKELPPQRSAARTTAVRSRKRVRPLDEEQAARVRILANASTVWIVDPAVSREFIRERQERGIDKWDEVWDGVYVVPPLANNPHQDLALDLATVLHGVIKGEGLGRVQAGANVSDRRQGWDKNFRAPDVVVVLNGGRAVDCTTHWMGGPDFLIEIQSPNDDTDEKIPFYSSLRVRELLIIHRDTRQLRLYRHDGRNLVLVTPSDFEGQQWLVSEVVPLAFRRSGRRSGARTEVRRTDGRPAAWTV